MSPPTFTPCRRPPLWYSIGARTIPSTSPTSGARLPIGPPACPPKTMPSFTAGWSAAVPSMISPSRQPPWTRRALDQRGLPLTEVEKLVLGWTVPQPQIFYGAPTLAARLGAEGVSGPMISQACATSAVCVEVAAMGVEGGDGLTLVVATDRTSNGPVLLYPQPGGMGGAPRVENW